MGDYEVASSTLSIFILTTFIYNLLTFLSFKDILRRFGFMKNTRRDFYECGFKPQTQKPIKVSIQFLIICVFFFTIARLCSLFVGNCPGLEEG